MNKATRPHLRKKRLGDLLRERGQISADDLYEAIQEQKEKVVLLGELLLQRGKVGKEDLAAALEEVNRVPYVDCRSVTIEPEVLELIPRSVALRYCALPLARENHKLVTVMAEPQDLRTIDELRFLSGMEISPRLGFRVEIQAAIEQCYANLVPLAEAGEEEMPFLKQVEVPDMEFLTASSSARNIAAIKEYQAELNKQRTPAVRLVSAIIAAAANKHASDIHIEPQAPGTIVRIRVDGVLRELTQVPTQLQTSLISRVKILADLDIAERRAPQDGRFLVRIGARSFDLRLSTLPTHYGEKVVIRLLDPNATRVDFSALGLAQENCEALAQLLAMPQGMLLVTGPTGSGKTTTLYAALNKLCSPTVNIVTVEDPIEYMVEGINQVQVNPKAGLTFASSLRSILRQDPNVIMVGEIRDSETAEIALKASQTGHMVLSTLHTNDSIAAIMRLLDLNISAALIASSVSAVLGQRLVRKLCTCRAETAMRPEYAARLPAGTVLDPAGKIFVPVGCAACDNTGYKGRVGIYELLILDDPLRASIRRNAYLDEICAVARSGGLRLLHEDALQKVKMGITSLKEVLRVVPFERVTNHSRQHRAADLSAISPFCPNCGSERRESVADGLGVCVNHSVVSHTRQGKRYTHLRDLAILYDGGSEDIPLRPPDLSARGMFLSTAHQFPEGAVLKVRFCLARTNFQVNARAEVRYCLPGVGIGVEFVEISPEAQRAIEEELQIARPVSPPEP